MIIFKNREVLKRFLMVLLITGALMMNYDVLEINDSLIIKKIGNLLLLIGSFAMVGLAFSEDQ